ncbi:MAG TPA: HlyD family efflux transporter periplasmic adaptor subunit [Steroidobacteraceae bacterium]|nr:HlyD family efflux transporter periplasmic adaptor subunit [Steroidobacteraceae bacterium]
MDKQIEKKAWPPQRIAVFAGVGVVVLGLVWVLLGIGGRNSVNAQSERISIAQVKQGEFQEYVPINGTVQPNTTVYLDLEEGGIVEKIYVEGGSPIKKGALILSFSNSAAQKQNIEAETRLIDNLNQLRNSKINLTQSNLMLKDQLLDLEYKINELEKTYVRYQQLMKSPNSQLSKEQFENTRDQLVYLKNKRELLQQRIVRETELQEQQSVQIDSSVKRVNRNLEILSRIIDALEVRAPIDGHLSTLSAEVGQSFQRGQRIGQIDQLQSFKVRANVDQFYISKVSAGQQGKFDFGGRSYQLEVTKIYPEVTNDVFQVDLVFQEGVPEGIKRGQTLQIDLGLSESKTTNVVAKGSFHRHTNGRWAYVVAPDGLSARRADIVTGRQNPQFVEVLEGLKVGDWIITSDYDGFNNAEELTFQTPLRN